MNNNLNEYDVEPENMTLTMDTLDKGIGSFSRNNTQ